MFFGFYVCFQGKKIFFKINETFITLSEIFSKFSFGTIFETRLKIILHNMKKIILPIVLALFSFGSVIAQTETPATPAVPQNPEFIQFKTSTHDFGNIKQNIPVSHVFNYKNVGDRDITINNVQASCGCTTPNWKGGIYKPGDNGEITATFNAASPGFFSKNITVMSSEGVMTLYITGTVLTDAEYNVWKAKKDEEDALNKTKTSNTPKAVKKPKSATKAKPATPAKPASKTK
jgi:hypothetical protein